MTKGNSVVLVMVAAGFSNVGLGQTSSLSNPHFPKQLEWKGSQNCVVPDVHTPCRTVRYHESSFGSSLGFEGIARIETVEAFDENGSQSKTIVVTKRPSGLSPAPPRKITSLVLRKDNRTLYIDHVRKFFEAHPAGGGMPYWEEDNAQCSNMKSRFLYLSDRLQDSVVAGIHVVGYRGRDYRGVDYDVYLAPSIGCQQMRFQMVMRGVFGWKTAEYEMVVDSYELGPPSPSLFIVPTGYSQVDSILRP